MEYISTRGSKRVLTSSQAIMQGIADDGGLYMPREIPTLTKEEIKEMVPMTYSERAYVILKKYLDDYDDGFLKSVCKEAYGEDRFGKDPAPVVSVREKLSVMELWHGPTSAFKDMALQIMPLLLSEALKMNDEKRCANIVVATSGDTGKAALEGYKNVNGTKITVFYPQDGVSNMQKLQMATQDGNNVNVCAINGNFDDAQNAVKAIFMDEDIKNKINGYAFLSSANSINWGRLVPQIVYYVSGYCDLIKAEKIKLGDMINVCVPTGNFGNIFAGYMAKCMGLPICSLICASNTNNILSDFLKTGIYNRNRRFYTTMSPSMDILISSNLERLLYLICGCEETAMYMKKLKEEGRYQIPLEKLRIINNTFWGGWCDEAKTADTIKKSFNGYNYLSDTHTAVALAVARDYMRSSSNERYMLALSTASPYKFPANVYKAITGETVNDEFLALELLEKHTKTEIPAPIKELKNKEVIFTKTVEKEEMASEVLSFIEKPL